MGFFQKKKKKLALTFVVEVVSVTLCFIIT